MATTPNTLYYGDNLEVLRQHVPDESVDQAAQRTRPAQGRQPGFEEAV